MMTRILVLIAILFSLSCVQHTLVESGEHTIKSFVVRPTSQWNQLPSQFSLAGLPTWTVDGLSLNTLLFISDVSDGETLLPNTDDKKYDTFDKDMLPTEIVELVESTLLLATNAKIINRGQLKPIKIGNTPGFQYEFEFVRQDEIRRKAYIASAIKNDQLHLMYFQATYLHYYDSLIQDVKSMIKTATIKSKS